MFHVSYLITLHSIELSGCELAWGDVEKAGFPRRGPTRGSPVGTPVCARPSRDEAQCITTPEIASRPWGNTIYGWCRILGVAPAPPRRAQQVRTCTTALPLICGQNQTTGQFDCQLHSLLLFWSYKCHYCGTRLGLREALRLPSQKRGSSCGRET